MNDLSGEIRQIWDADEELQLSCLRFLSEAVRHVKDPEIIEKDVKTWRAMGAFFVPDETYLPTLLGKQIMQYKYGIYRNGYCVLSERLALPLKAPNGNVLGFVGYSNTGIEITELEDEATDQSKDNTAEEEVQQSGLIIKYLYPPSYVFEKGRFLYCEPEWYKQAIRDGYICLTDGLFDAIRLNQEGINAASLCGSMLTNWHKLYLSFIPTKIIVGDNDKAGVRLCNKCMKELPGCVPLRYSGAGDIDDFLKSKENILEIQEIVKKILATGLSLTEASRGLVKYKHFDQLNALEIKEDEKFKEFANSSTVQERGQQVRNHITQTTRLRFVKLTGDLECKDSLEDAFKLTDSFTTRLKEKYGKTD